MLLKQVGILLNKLKQKIIIFIFFILSISNLSGADNKKESIISNNGNFLFYNSPVVTRSDTHTFVAFANNKGDIVVNKYDSNNTSHKENTFIVHNYKDQIDRVNKSINKLLKADDHSAPAIFYDDTSKRLLLATSYHCTDLFIYEYNEDKNGFALYKHFKGSYTYPRFIKNGSDMQLVVRNLEIVNKIRFGNLVYFSSKDNFRSKQIIKKSLPDSVIYASRPFVSNSKIYFTYAEHFYKSGNMLGWKILEFNPSKNQIVKEIDLSSFLENNYFYNRPTSIALTKGKLLVATSYFNKKEKFSKAKLYTWENTVLILEIDRNDLSKKTMHRSITNAPYYNTDVFIDDKLNWLYFDQNKTISNKKINKLCFNHEYMMYPNIFHDSVYYVKVNDEHYSLRDQNNSIIMCQKYAE